MYIEAPATKIRMSNSTGRTPKVKEFVNAPYIRCPDCGTDGAFGVLMINDHQYVRRCVNCWFDQKITLPPIKKRTIYLDQFVISNMMKELDPDRPVSAKGTVDGFYRQLFSILDRLSKLQLIVCPDSPVQDHESVVDTRYENLRLVFRQLSHGVSFRDPETLHHAQIIRAFDSWMTGSPKDSEVRRDFALTRNPDVWQGRFRLELNYTVPELSRELSERSKAINLNLHEVCEGWKNDPDFSFKRAFEDELSGQAKNILDQFYQYTARMAAVQLGQAQLDLDLCFPPQSIFLVTRMMKSLSVTVPEVNKQLERIGDFFRSEHFRSVPAARITALFWASIAREVRSGRSAARFPKAGMFNDIDAVAAYSTHCDAMFVDKEIAHFASQRELKKELSGMARLFSLREKNEFLEFLNSIEASAPAAHLALVAEVYGPNGADPYTELLSRNRHR